MGIGEADHPLPSSHTNIGPAEVAPFEQQGLAGLLRQRVGEAIAKVQTCMMTPLPELTECVSRQEGLIAIDCNHFDTHPLQQGV